MTTISATVTGPDIDTTVTGDTVTVTVNTGGGGAVSSVFGRTGAVVAASGDYTAAQVSETAAAKIMTAAERTKLSGIETGADVTDAENVEDAVTGTDAVTDPTDAGVFAVVVSAVLKRVTWANIKATLKTYFDTLYATIGHNHSGTYLESETDPVFSASEAAGFVAGDKAALDAAISTANAELLGKCTVTTLGTLSGTQSITPNLSGIRTQIIEATFDSGSTITINAPTNAAAGDVVVFQIQLGSSASSVTWNEAYYHAAGTPTLTTDDQFAFIYNGSVWRESGQSIS